MVIKSPKFSMKGWHIVEWFKGNWKTIKELIKVGLPALVGWSVTHHPALTGLITILGKFILDMGDYYLNQQ